MEELRPDADKRAERLAKFGATAPLPPARPAREFRRGGGVRAPRRGPPVYRAPRGYGPSFRYPRRPSRGGGRGPPKVRGRGPPTRGRAYVTREQLDAELDDLTEHREEKTQEEQEQQGDDELTKPE